MYEKIVGGVAIVLALFSLAPSYVPGVASFFGLGISIVAVRIAVFSVKQSMTLFHIPEAFEI